MELLKIEVPPGIELRGNGLVLRPFVESDVNAVFAAATESVGHISPWMEWCHEEYSRSDAEAFVLSRADAWHSGTELAFGIWDEPNGELSGACGLNAIHRLHRFANLGYWVRKSKLRRGVAVHATQLLARFAFERIGLARVELLVQVGNEASAAVARRAGARLEATLRDRVWNRGRAHDAWMWSLIPGDMSIDSQAPRSARRGAC